MMQGTAAQTCWIGVDWGTTHLRAWAMSASGTRLAAASSDMGMARLTRDGFEPALCDIAGDWIAGPTPVIACGMVGSRQGWVEAPYARVPCAALPAGLVTASTLTPGLSVHVIPGIRQDDPADVMRGEETQIAGFLSINPGWDGVVCLPGTHTKWVHVSAGEVVSFQTFMTGELFAAIGTGTVLRHSIAGEGWDADAFAQALSDILSRPERLAARLFSLRAEHLLHGLAGTAARARLSGLLIGAELAAARPYWLGQQIAVLGNGSNVGLYIAALATQSVAAMQVDGERATLAGLTVAWRRIKDRIPT
jgi:2-dehydro-3-deoxygalactonokinase